MLVKENKGKYELKNIIKQMYLFRKDEITDMIERDNTISLDELGKLPEDIRNEIIQKLKERKLLERENHINDYSLYEQFYITGFKDGISTLLESLE